MNDPQETPVEEFQHKLHIDAALAEKLLAGELTSIEEVAYVPFNEFLEVTGLSNDNAISLRRIAKLYLLNESLDGLF